MAKKSQLEIKAFRAVSNAALASDTLPTRIKILDWGTSTVHDGSKVILDDVSYGLFSANQSKIGRDRIALDSNHCTVPGTQAYKDFGATPTVFAYGAPKIIPGEGLFMEDLQWTPAGKASAKNFEDISPAPILKNDRVIGIHSAALTTAGAIPDLHFFSAHDNMDDLVRALAAVCPTCGGPYNVDTKDVYKEQLNNADQGIKSMIDKPLTHAPTEYASEDDEIKAIKAKWAQKGGKNGPLDNPNPHGGTEITPLPFGDAEWTKVVSDAVHPMSARLDAIEASLKEATKNAEKAERSSLVAQAGADGKVIPLSAEDIEATPIVVLRNMVKALPKAVVPIKPIVKAFSVDDKGNPKGLYKSASAFEAAIRDNGQGKYLDQLNASRGRN